MFEKKGRQKEQFSCKYSHRQAPGTLSWKMMPLATKSDVAKSRVSSRSQVGREIQAKSPVLRHLGRPRRLS